MQVDGQSSAIAAGMSIILDISLADADDPWPLTLAAWTLTLTRPGRQVINEAAGRRPNQVVWNGNLKEDKNKKSLNI